MSHSVNGFDSGELATVQATWGIAHPTGYPFFAILGFIFSKIPLPFSTIFKLNLLCVLWNSLTIFFLIKTVKYISYCLSVKVILLNIVLKIIQVHIEGMLICFDIELYCQ